MNNLQIIKKALDYIEDHLSEKILLRDIATVANFSEYHFHRMFRTLTGYAVKDYIRKRRLYLAAVDILNGVDSLVNIAQKYQFSSQASFSVAFKQLHGITPGRVLKSDDFKVFGKMVLNDIELCRPKGLLKEPTLVSLESFSVFGKEIQVSYGQLHEKENPISQLWNSLDSLNYEEQSSIYAVYEYNPKEMHLEDIRFTYTLGYKVDSDTGQSNNRHKNIAESRYLLFQVTMEDTTLFNIYDYIDEQWLPLSEHILSEKADFEIHHHLGALYTVDIYISIEE